MKINMNTTEGENEDNNSKIWEQPDGTDQSQSDADAVCANCGIAGLDNVKLEECDTCKLFLCGSEWCRVVHRRSELNTCLRL